MLLACALLPAILWLILRFTMAPGPYEMDSPTGKGTFFPHLVIYSVFYYVLAGISAWGACSAWHYGADWGALLLLFAMAYSLIFNIWLAFNFETYMHARYIVGNPALNGMIGKSPYTLNRYAATLALAVSALLLFLVGVVITAAVMVVK